MGLFSMFRTDKQTHNLPGLINVCHITTGHSVASVRIFHKECKTLKKAGFRVFLIGPSKEDTIIQGIFVRALPQPNSKFDRIFKNTVLCFIASLKVNAQLYHFHDPELIFVGFFLKFLGRRVIYDVHEDVPKQIFHKNMFGNRVFNRIIGTVFFRLQKVGSLFFDGIVGVSPSIVNKFDKNKTILVRNFPILDLIAKANEKATKEQPPVCIYPGLLSKKRGIKEVIEAIGMLEGKVQLLLMGKWENPHFKRECESLKGWLYTKYLGHVAVKQVYSYMKASTVGIVNYHESGIEAIPNKPFEYMACGLPVIMSNRPDWQRLFESSALFVNPKDPANIAQAIDLLVENEALRKQLETSGCNLVNGKLNWEWEGKTLVQFYKKLFGSNFFIVPN